MPLAGLPCAFTLTQVVWPGPPPSGVRFGIMILEFLPNSQPGQRYLRPVDYIALPHGVAGITVRVDPLTNPATHSLLVGDNQAGVLVYGYQ